jgi:dephospho-CoA kinase
MLIGVTGTNGGGKGVVVESLVKKGFAHYSVRDLIMEEVERRGLELNRTNIGETGTSLRREFGPGYFTKITLEQAKSAGQENVVIESIRALAEAEYLRAQGGFVVAVDAPEVVRYERIVERGTVTDRVSFEEFRAQEEAEYSSKDPNDPTLMNVRAVIAGADYTITNDGTYEELERKVDEMLTKLGS